MNKMITPLTFLFFCSITATAQLDVHTNAITSIAVDRSGNIFVGCSASSWPGAIYKIDTKGQLSVYASGGLSYAQRTLSSSHSDFIKPVDMCVDSHGNLIVLDALRYNLKNISPGGSVVILAGTGKSGANDGPGATASFSNPRAICMDKSDNIFIIDQDGRSIRKMSPEGTVSTVLATSSSIVSMNDIAVDSKHNLYVTDVGVIKKSRRRESSMCSQDQQQPDSKEV